MPTTWPLASSFTQSGSVAPPGPLSAIQQARLSMLVEYAEGEYLAALAQNYGVPRPVVLTDEEMFRDYVKLLSWLPKTIKFTVYKALEIAFGTQAALVAAGQRAWEVYEVKNNELLVEVPLALITSNNEVSSYLHGFTAEMLVGTTDTIVIVSGDARLSSATTLVGKTIGAYVRNSETWETDTIASVSYNAGTDQTTLTLSTNWSDVPAVGDRMYIEIPGDGTASYRGDYLTTGGFVGLFTTAAGAPTTTISVRGDATAFLRPDHVVTLNYSSTTTTRTISTIAYVSTTNITTIVLTATVPADLSGTISLAREEADGAGSTTPPHDDRVYLQQNGIYEVAEFYLKLIKACGVGLKAEFI
jgi:hypothetical protein